MRSQKVNFTNSEGTQLAARLEWPVNQHPHSFAIFAHCFTCGKSLSVVRQISMALNLSGVAVLRFDFTGLGESEGEFADTNFSSNVEDLIAAANYLEQEFQSPALLVGHSLGGAAVLCAAAQLPAVKAVATIAAPFDPAHVQHLLESVEEEIDREGLAKVNIGGRSFTVKKQFLEDIREQNLVDKIKHLKKALLIMHSPQDKTVSIDNASRIYHAAMHPKSYVSLDGADHLLSDKKDAAYVGDMIGSWVKRYLDLPDKEDLRSDKAVAVRLGEEGYTTEIMVRHHSLQADEPESVGGNDFGPSPYELVAAGLGACTAMTLQMYARRKKWPLEEVVVHLEHYKDYRSDQENLEDPKSKIDHFSRTIEIEGDLDETQRQRLLEIANKCPVHRTMEGEIEVVTDLRMDKSLETGKPEN
ncbi:bifunctional alpha/beta hydrolase/OsmC family protein [Flavilitoribacter nigricans]|uniref:Osmotically inducible protein C n=1 Tax=Flavilitoribacter nigricans (strain ATCC 23147 / DSM 23189 / NBRC 102662 / NCIMB 1420 / SS-2) TaxID=1122177 RepID=A0A2D0N929_FLAN2|nr:bifunctional alpha/beta hydrolase/OsmC family protein [Flavilitoribacter nigricans]PHN04888.1 osmotically inducible protein C [Flavilitoribacter nigricans DSM 23189 = NBRC 102662]